MHWYGIQRIASAGADGTVRLFRAPRGVLTAGGAKEIWSLASVR